MARVTAEPVVIERKFTEKGIPKLAITDPEYTLSLIALISSFCGAPLVGFITGIIAIKQSKAAGRNNLFAFLGILFGSIIIGFILLYIIAYIIIIALFVSNGYGHGRMF